MLKIDFGIKTVKYTALKFDIYLEICKIFKSAIIRLFT